jgi:hypothetical protein
LPSCILAVAYLPVESVVYPALAIGAGVAVGEALKKKPKSPN